MGVGGVVVVGGGDGWVWGGCGVVWVWWVGGGVGGGGGGVMGGCGCGVVWVWWVWWGRVVRVAPLPLVSVPSLPWWWLRVCRYDHHGAMLRLHCIVSPLKDASRKRLV